MPLLYLFSCVVSAGKRLGNFKKLGTCWSDSSGWMRNREPDRFCSDWWVNFASLHLNSHPLPFCFQYIQKLEGKIAPVVFAVSESSTRFLQQKSFLSSKQATHIQKRWKNKQMQCQKKHRAHCYAFTRKTSKVARTFRVLEETAC